jgi:hypothetical protein
VCVDADLEKQALTQQILHTHYNTDSLDGLIQRYCHDKLIHDIKNIQETFDHFNSAFTIFLFFFYFFFFFCIFCMFAKLTGPAFCFENIYL